MKQFGDLYLPHLEHTSWLRWFLLLPSKGAIKNVP